MIESAATQAYLTHLDEQFRHHIVKHTRITACVFWNNLPIQVSITMRVETPLAPQALMLLQSDMI